MNRPFSAHLDVLRVTATVAVLISHFAYERFSRGDYLIIREWNIGSDAVILFFVISGFVISYTATNKDRTAGRYAFARISRLYSVVFPALMLTVLLDAAGVSMNPDAYAGWWLNPAPAAEILARGLSFSTEWGTTGFRPGTNGPFWSLSYEAAYYMLFGIFVFTSGFSRMVLLAAAILLIGFKPLLLIPAWLMGVWMHRKGVELRLNRFPAVVAFVAPLLIYAFAVSAGFPNLLLNATLSALGEEGFVALRYSNEFVWNGALGVLAIIHLVGAFNLLRTLEIPKKIVGPVRWLAGASFSVYLVHYPALQFWHAVLPESWSNMVRDFFLLGLTLVLCFIFAALFERTLPALRQAIKTMPAFRR